MAQAVLFDLDGTLLDPNGSIRGTLELVLEEAGLAPLGGDILVGMPLRDILASRADAAQVEALVARYRQLHMAKTWRLVRFHDGMEALVRSLPVPLAVVTTKGHEETEALLSELGIRDAFAVVVGDDDVRPVKPHPAPVLEACKRLGVRPREAVMVGDTRFDVAAGRAAGCTTVGVLWGHGGTDAHGVAEADHVVSDAAQLKRLLVRLCG